MMAKPSKPATETQRSLSFNWSFSVCSAALWQNFLSVIGARQVIQGWSGRPNRAIGPATLGPLDRGNTDWIFCRFLFVNINA